MTPDHSALYERREERGRRLRRGHVAPAAAVASAPPPVAPGIQAAVPGPFTSQASPQSPRPVPQAPLVAPGLPSSFPPPAQIARGSKLVIPPMMLPAMDCVICSDELSNDKHVVCTTCMHFFHNDCLLNWQRAAGDVYSYSDPLERRSGTFDVTFNKNLCPICRTRLF